MSLLCTEPWAKHARCWWHEECSPHLTNITHCFKITLQLDVNPLVVCTAQEFSTRLSSAPKKHPELLRQSMGVIPLDDEHGTVGFWSSAGAFTCFENRQRGGCATTPSPFTVCIGCDRVLERTAFFG